jgi:hypothetical protein
LRGLGPWKESVYLIGGLTPRYLDEALPLGGAEIFPATGRVEEGEAIVRPLVHANLG